MKKKLIALAALTACGIASAQSSVTLFGVLDLAYENVKTNAGRISGLAPSIYNSNKIGFRGVEDLGGGLSAGFWLEAAISPNSGFGSSGTSQNNQSTTIPPGGLTFNRRSTVSLSGGFGEVRLGRDFVPSYHNYYVYDPFVNNGVGASLTAHTGAGESVAFVRASNSVGYFLPGNLGGFYGQAMYAFGNRASTETTARPAVYGVTPVNTKNNGRYTGVRLGWGNGPFDTAIGYGRTTYAPGTNTATILGMTGFTYGHFTDLNWGAAYTFGPVKVMGQYARQKLDDAVVPGNDVTVKGFQLGAIYTVGVGEIAAAYSRMKVSDLVPSDPRATKWAVGYRHHLSKRTTLVAYYARVKNSGGAAQTATSFSSGNLGAVAGPANINGRSTGFELGLDHTF